MNREELQKVHDALSLLNSMVNCGDQHSPTSINMTQAAFAILRKPLPPAEGVTDKFRDVLHEVQRLIETEGGATESEMKAIWNSLSCAITESERRSQPPAEGAENVTEDMYEKAETFLQSKDVWNHPYISDRENKTGYEVTFLIAEFATLHAQRIADKMVSERLREETYMKCDVCGCHPSVIITTSFGKFCQQHAKYV